MNKYDIGRFTSLRRKIREEHPRILSGADDPVRRGIVAGGHSEFRRALSLASAITKGWRIGSSSPRPVILETLAGSTDASA
jgi:hypothetical protein